MSKQLAPYFVQQVVLTNGERLPFLCSRASGVPLFLPTVFALTELRATNRATATIAQALRAVMVLHLGLDALGIDLTQRLDEGRLLDLGEIEALSQLCGKTVDRLVEDLIARNAADPVVVRLDRVREKRNAEQSGERVNSETAAIRLLYIHRYLKWVTAYRLLKLGSRDALTSEVRSAFDLSLRALAERIPPSSSRNTVGKREGLAKGHLQELEEVIKPDSARNPWKGAHARERNHLIVRLLSFSVRPSRPPFPFRFQLP